MIELMESGDKYSVSKIDPTRTSASFTQMNFHDDNLSLHRLLTKLNIPINCLDNHQIRQHYLEEYSAKYSKAKHLLNNARKKQRKIIMTYYEEKEKQDNMNELEIVKESLLEENEKIKKFKEALKDKLIIYQQRIQFLKDAEFWSAIEVQQLQNNTIEISTENSPITNDSLHLLHDHEQIKYLDILVDDSCPTITGEYYSKRKSYEDDFFSIDDNKPDLQFDETLLTENYNLIEILSKHRQSSHTELISEIDENVESSISTKKTKDYFQWLKNVYQFFIILISNVQFDRFKILSTILMISLAIFLVIFVNDLLEYFLIYLTQPSIPITTLSPPDSMIKSLFTYLLSTIYNCTTSGLLPLFRIFEFSV